MSQAGINTTSSSITGNIKTLTGNSGGAVGPNGSGNINVLGGVGVTTVGSPGTNTLTINATGGGFTWQTVTTSQTLAASNGYILSGGTGRNFSLPATAAVGDAYAVATLGSAAWTILIGGGQNLVQGATSGTTSMVSVQTYSAVQIVCIVANTTFLVTSLTGSATLT